MGRKSIRMVRGTTDLLNWYSDTAIRRANQIPAVLYDTTAWFQLRRIRVWILLHHAEPSFVCFEVVRGVVTTVYCRCFTSPKQLIFVGRFLVCHSNSTLSRRLRSIDGDKDSNTNISQKSDETPHMFEFLCLNPSLFPRTCNIRVCAYMYK